MVKVAQRLDTRGRAGDGQELGHGQAGQLRTAQQYELHFQPLRETTRGYTFPCDAHGRVDMDRLAHPKLNDYLFARVFIGREFSMPAVRPALEPA